MLNQTAVLPIFTSMTIARVTTPSELRDAYQAVLDRIANAAAKVGRKPEDVLLVAVTKYATPDQIRMLVDMGQMDLGESRVQQLEKRVASLSEFLSRKRTLGSASTREDVDFTKAATHVRWHMIGHLQRNKAKQIVNLVDLTHSVDSLRLAEELHHIGVKRDKPIDILLQVNASGETTKSGVAIPAVIHLAEQIDSMVNLRLRGLMTMAPDTEDLGLIRATFQRTSEVFQEVKKLGIGGKYFTALSMGMSNDFELAIECGANVVRVGSALFGDAEPGESEID
ncbi:MAG TPA: YggS family pyridoxal phosphate-dependent enzyme [Phycisphaerales bacterium]|nr:YggS family pyridoxal phosphate-dependent enzyme [Phycisphaerales bacterium]HCD32011.1 YggS family pyridoxal phosphate-dependent enzyme [Phycisphaerales bacterium]|tara:strand:- start:74 stop:919 length:846 start_codon:yes stop_codon:yes gene_type:complete